MKKNFNEKKINNFIFIFLIFSISAFLTIFMKCDNDYFWHIKAGEYMFNNGVLKSDVFSWFASGKSWISHEWLFEIILYFLKIIFSKYHLLIYGFLSIFILLITIYYSQKTDFLKNIPFSLLWISFSIIFMSSMQGRPNLISFNFLSLTIMLLYDNYKNKDSKKIYLLPFIAILWANIHGGSSNLIYILCILFYFCGLVEFKSSKIYSNKISKTQRKKYIYVFFLCFISLNINIHGFKMILYPYINMLDSTMLGVIQEWQPINLNTFGHYPYLLLVLFIFIIMIFSNKKINFIDFILFLLSVFLGFKSIRFCCYTYIIMSYVVFNYINSRKEDKGTKTLVIVFCVGLISIFVLNFNKIVNNTNKNILSKIIIKKIKKENPQKLFNDYNLGGELIYNGIPVFVDGRADLYSKLNLNDYLLIYNTSYNFIKLVDDYDFDYFLVNNNSNINYFLSTNNYIVIVSDNNYTLYKKN